MPRQLVRCHVKDHYFRNCTTSPDNCGKFPHWHPSREAQEPLPRTIKGLRGWDGRGEGKTARATAARALAPHRAPPFRRRPPSGAVAFAGRNEPAKHSARVRVKFTSVRARHTGVEILCSRGPRGWAVTGAIFGCSAILHQSRPIQAGSVRPLLWPSIRGARSRYPRSAPARRSFTAVATHRTRIGVNLVIVYQYCTDPGLPVVTAPAKQCREERNFQRFFLPLEFLNFRRR